MVILIELKIAQLESSKENIMKDTEAQLIKLENLKTHPRSNKPAELIRVLVDDLNVSGWDQTIIMDEDHIVLSGDSIRLAAIKAGRSDILARIRKGLTLEQKMEYIVSDNMISLKMNCFTTL